MNYRISPKNSALLIFRHLLAEMRAIPPISASALVLRHSQPTAQCAKALCFTEQRCRRVLFETRARCHALQLFGASGTSATSASKYWASRIEIIYFARNF